MNKCSVVVSFDCDHPYSADFQAAEDLLRLAQVGRFYSWPVKQIAGNQKNVRLFFNALSATKPKAAARSECGKRPSRRRRPRWISAT
jgi:hypothetical protein